MLWILDAFIRTVTGVVAAVSAKSVQALREPRDMGSVDDSLSGPLVVNGDQILSPGIGRKLTLSTECGDCHLVLPVSALPSSRKGEGALRSSIHKTRR